MRLSDIKKILKCQWVFPTTGLDADNDIDIQFAYASDLMSDILVAVKRGSLLLTGLTNNQVIRTSKVAATSAIVFVRGKKPTSETVTLAQQYHIPILTTDLSMFDACGILFTNGVRGVRGISAGR